ncbi:MAG: HD domain-containing protein [Butyrivibrio sp.]|nr:HD domain-containing protein [Butyrivibrio sp.]
MMEILLAHQLNIISFLTGIGVIITIFAIIASSLSRNRRIAIIMLEVSAIILLNFDRFAYLYDGNPGVKAYYMVRISNFLVFFMTLVVIFAFNLYIEDVLLVDCGLKKVPRRVKAAGIILTVGMVLVIVSQFTGLYYTFDESNTYHRAPLFIICYILPIIAPIIEFTAVYQYRRLMSRHIYISLVVFITVPLISSFIQIFFYGFSFTDMAFIIAAAILFVFALVDINEKVRHANTLEINYLKQEKENAQRLFGQMATAFIGAIEEKEPFSIGHSLRVASYSVEIARRSGKSEEECKEVYYSALMHDVGKIGIPIAILQKSERLTEEEEQVMRKHVSIGQRILSSVSEYPYLSIGAHYHHERYDGTGYPEGLSGKDIPEIGRIICVADHYDRMTTRKRYRGPLPQAVVRDELIRRAGSQFDPDFAGIMVKMIDADSEYRMQEKGEELPPKEKLVCNEYRSDILEGIVITPSVKSIRFMCRREAIDEDQFGAPSVIVFDAYDGLVHDDEFTIKAFSYLEYGEIWFDGHMISTGARNMIMKPVGDQDSEKRRVRGRNRIRQYEIQAGRFEDHVRIRMISPEETKEVIIALPNSSKYAFIGLTGEHCLITDIQVEDTGRILKEGEIDRIAERVDYTNRMESDIPNLQINGPKEAATEGIPVEDGMEILFHSMSLPTASLLWQCPYVMLFSSEDKTIFGENYHEYAHLKMNGENEWQGSYSENSSRIIKDDKFESWEKWEERNKRGVECRVIFERKGDKIITTTECAGLTMKNTTTLLERSKEVYCSLSGDQCALTDIRIRKPRF